MRLSICIPTYNRGPYLPELLASIERQWDERVEVVVSDNGSSDETQAILARWMARLPAMKVVRQARNIGPDRNFLAVVEAACGDFCWLMGSDDRLEPGGIARVLDGCTRHPDIAGFLVNVLAYDVAMQHRILVSKPMPFTTDAILEGAEHSFGVLFNYLGYLSSNVVRRDLWRAVCATGEPMAQLNAYVHVFIIGRMLQRCPRWGIIATPCVGWRAGNDSFLSDGWLRRMEIDVIGYGLLAEGLFGPGSRMARTLRDQVAGGHVYRHFRGAKGHGQSPGSLRRGARLLTRTYWRSPAYWTRLLPWILLPNRIARAGVPHVQAAPAKTFPRTGALNYCPELLP